MAKVTELKFQIGRTPYSVAVYCNSKGVFTANIPVEISNSLNVKEKMEAGSLKELKSEFYDAIERYKTAETKEELFIAVQYQASGFYNKGADGGQLFNHRSPFSFSGFGIDSLGFEFDVVIRKTVDKIESWHEASLGQPDSVFDHYKDEDPNLYYKRGPFYGSNYKKIPFSPEALETLTKAREMIRKASETLFTVLNQDENLIEQALTKQTLLN